MAAASNETEKTADGSDLTANVTAIPSLVDLKDDKSSAVKAIPADSPLAAGALVYTLAGASDEEGFVDGVSGATAQFAFPYGVCVDHKTEQIVIADGGNHRVRVYGIADGVVTTLAGGGSAGATGAAEVESSGFADGSALDAARFVEPVGVCMDAADGTSVIVADADGHRIRRIKNGVVSTIAGRGGDGSGGFADGDAASAEFAAPRAVAYLDANTLVVLDVDNNRLRCIDLKAQTVRTLCGTGTEGSADGALSEATFDSMTGFAVDSESGAIVVTCLESIRLVDTKSNRVSTLIRTSEGKGLGVPTGVVFVPGSGAKQFFVGDSRAHVIWCFDRTTSTLTRVAGVIGGGEINDRDGSALKEAEFRTPVSLCWATPTASATASASATAVAGNTLIVCDQDAMKLRKIVFPDASSAAGTAAAKK